SQRGAEARHRKARSAMTRTRRRVGREPFVLTPLRRHGPRSKRPRPARVQLGRGSGLIRAAASVVLLGALSVVGSRPAGAAPGVRTGSARLLHTSRSAGPTAELQAASAPSRHGDVGGAGLAGPPSPPP